MNLSMRYLLYALVFLFFIGCDKEDNPIPLIADAGLSQTVKPQNLVTLDGSSSSGPEGFTYSWTYEGEVPESEINFQDKTTANPTFTPPVGAVYTFTLTITLGGQTSSDQVTVVASGGIEIGGTLSSDLALIDIEPDANIPDYVVTSDLIVPAGITLSVADENVLVYFESTSGLHVTNGGKLSNILTDAEEGLNIVFSGDDIDGWKGIWIENAIIELNDATIENAGKEKFEENSEPASLILEGAQTDLISIDGNTFKNSFSYDILVPDIIGGDGQLKHNHLSYKYPVKAHITFLDFYISNYPNIYPENHEYSIFIPSGKDHKDVINNTFRFFDGRFYIDGDFWAGSPVSMNRCTVYIKGGAGILAEDDFNCSGLESQTNFVGGYEGAQWKGIATTSRNKKFIVQYSTIENAGYGIIEMGDFKAEAQATLYANNLNGRITDSRILNGGGFGFYNSDTISNNEQTIRFSNNEFINLQKAAIRTNVPAVSRLFFTENPENYFELPSGIPAILVQGNGSPTLRWIDLGGDNFYMIDAHIITSNYDGFTLDAGVHMKFKSGRYYKYNPSQASGARKVTWLGTVDKPIILEGETDSPGSWGGVYLGGFDGWFEVEYCTIKNGGEFIIPGASEKANMISADNGEWPELIKFNNNTISGSAGYGIVVEAGTENYEYDAAEKNNIFTNNNSDNVIVK